jgi:hypothetical protein
VRVWCGPRLLAERTVHARDGLIEQVHVGGEVRDISLESQWERFVEEGARPLRQRYVEHCVFVKFGHTLEDHREIDVDLSFAREDPFSFAPFASLFEDAARDRDDGDERLRWAAAAASDAPAFVAFVTAVPVWPAGETLRAAERAVESVRDPAAIGPLLALIEQDTTGPLGWASRAALGAMGPVAIPEVRAVLGSARRVDPLLELVLGAQDIAAIAVIRERLRRELPEDHGANLARALLILGDEDGARSALIDGSVALQRALLRGPLPWRSPTGAQAILAVACGDGPEDVRLAALAQLTVVGEPQEGHALAALRLEDVALRRARDRAVGAILGRARGRPR